LQRTGDKRQVTRDERRRERDERRGTRDEGNENRFAAVPNAGGKIKVITAWRYPGVSSKRDPVPEEIIREVQSLL